MDRLIMSSTYMEGLEYLLSHIFVKTIPQLFVKLLSNVSLLVLRLFRSSPYQKSLTRPYDKVNIATVQGPTLLFCVLKS